MYTMHNNTTVFDILSQAAHRLASISATPALDAEILMAHTLNIERHTLPLHYSTHISKIVYKKFENLLLRRLQSEPIAYIIGYKEFYSLPFHVNPHVLIPRPETELIVDYALYYAHHNATILDIGTGSGAIAIAIKYNLTDCSVWATDISADALRIAKKNAATLLGKNKIKFLHSDLFTSLPHIHFDVIVSNPPYINPEIYTALQKDIFFEPAGALVAPDHGFGIIKTIINNADNYLTNDGVLILEISDDLAHQIVNHTQSLPYTISIAKDYSGLQRVAILHKTIKNISN